MYQLSNAELKVDVLDPVQDQARLGSRYCAGGYVYQVHHSLHGKLLSGPDYPADPPLPFNGQGLPEAFEIALGQDQVQVGGDVLVLGVGVVTRHSPNKPFHVRYNPQVKEYAVWEVRAAPEAITMATRQRFGAWELRLEREVRLAGASLTSRTRVINQGQGRLPVRWFAHPFFPIPPEGECCAFSVEMQAPDSPGFRINPKGFIQMKSGYNWQAGCYYPLNLPFGFPITVTQKHPKLEAITVDCDFPVAGMPIWGNDRTFSFEPYFHTVLPPGQEAEWALRYRF